VTPKAGKSTIMGAMRIALFRMVFTNCPEPPGISRGKTRNDSTSRRKRIPVAIQSTPTRLRVRDWWNAFLAVSASSFRSLSSTDPGA